MSYSIFITTALGALFVSACVHKNLGTPRYPAASGTASNELVLDDLITLPKTVKTAEREVNIASQMDQLQENTLGAYAPDHWNVRRWLNHYYRTNPNLFAEIIRRKLTHPNHIFDLIRETAESSLRDPKLISAITTYTAGSDGINGALWKSKSFVFEPGEGDVSALVGVTPGAIESARNLRKAIETLKPTAPQKHWVLFRGTEVKLALLYDLLQKMGAGQPGIYPHYGFGSYSADFTVGLRFTRADIVTKSDIADVLTILKNPNREIAQREIQKKGYDWNKTSVAALLIRLTQKSMSILLDSWSRAPGELEAIQNPENIQIDNMFSLADNCRKHENEVVPDMDSPVHTTRGNMLIPDAIDQMGMLILESNDLGSPKKLRIDKTSIAAICTLRASINPSM